jgi:prevent-host-death family protein
MDVQPVSSLKANMTTVLRDLVNNRKSVLVVSKGRPQAVLQDVASYQETRDAIALLKMVNQSEASISAGRGSSTKDVIGRLKARVRSRAASA